MKLKVRTENPVFLPLVIYFILFLEKKLGLKKYWGCKYNPYNPGSYASAVNCVVNYPAVENEFMKLNCTPASSAAVERLFSASAQVLTDRRCRMQDNTLDMHIFLRSILKH